MVQDRFIHDNFLLENSYAEELYHTYAKGQPIIDYHNHLSPQQIAEDTIFGNLTKVWIEGDHYKYRAMRTLGISEDLITGSASDEEKFSAWSKTVPYTMRNPLYHWTHLELARYFEIYDLLSEQNSNKIYAETSEKLNSAEYSCRQLLLRANAKVVCTTEDPIDDLRYHKQIASQPFGVKVSTAFRPDKAILIGNPSYTDYLEKLEEVSGVTIDTYDQLCEVLLKRIKYFNAHGCKLCDHGLAQICFESYTQK